VSWGDKVWASGNAAAFGAPSPAAARAFPRARERASPPTPPPHHHHHQPPPPRCPGCALPSAPSFGDCAALLLDAFEGRLEQQQAHSTGWPSLDEIFRVGGWGRRAMGGGGLPPPLQQPKPWTEPCSWRKGAGARPPDPASQHASQLLRGRSRHCAQRASVNGPTHCSQPALLPPTPPPPGHARRADARHWRAQQRQVRVARRARSEPRGAPRLALRAVQPGEAAARPRAPAGGKARAAADAARGVRRGGAAHDGAGEPGGGGAGRAASRRVAGGSTSLSACQAGGVVLEPAAAAGCCCGCALAAQGLLPMRDVTPFHT
jgi:hypothetical protein